jgi:hypothetical protein
MKVLYKNVLWSGFIISLSFKKYFQKFRKRFICIQNFLIAFLAGRFFAFEAHILDFINTA